MYAGAWIDAWYIASRLPKTVDTGPADHGPVMMVRAHGSDSVDHVFDAARNVALIRIGGLTWRIHDQAAWASTEQKWREVSALAPWSCPSAATRPAKARPAKDYDHDPPGPRSEDRDRACDARLPPTEAPAGTSTNRAYPHRPDLSTIFRALLGGPSRRSRQ